MSHVIQLVGIQQDSQSLYLTQQGKQFLQQLDHPISIVTIAGLYRTGKSYLVNQLLQRLNTHHNSDSGKFIVGNSIQSCTKGLNVWSIPYKSSFQSKTFYYIVIDSEGIGSIQQQINYDMNLLMLIFLISSTVIYNSVGTIDQQSLDQLRVLVNLKKCLGNSEANTQPRFIWVLRDFALQLINKKGQTMTSNQYLQDCLEIVNSSNKQIVKKNQIRQAIKQNLPKRQCHTLVRPTIKQEQLVSLHELPKQRLREQFVEQTDQLFQSIFSNQQSDIKYLNQKNNFVNGPTLIKMIQYYLNQINSNKVPQITSVWQLINSTKLDQIMEECQNQIKRKILKIDLPLPEQELKSKLNQILNIIFSKYQSQISSDLKTYKKFSQKFIEISNKINNKIRKANNQIKNKKAFKQTRDTINRQIEFDKIDPCQLNELRSVIQKLDLKSVGDTQIYEYVINTIFDIIYISQKKAIKMRTSLQMMQQTKQIKDEQGNIKQEQLFRLKHDYHQALKQISLMRSSCIQNQKDLAISKQELSLLQSKHLNLAIQKSQKEQQLRRKIDELSQKLRRRNEQSNEAMKVLRQQNQSLITDLQEAKSFLSQKKLQQRKQIIFEQKIKQSWDRFEQQRSYFKKQLQKYKSLYIQTQQNMKSISQKYQKLQLLYKNQREGYIKKQRQFCQQLKWMKQNYSKTKDAYNQSLHTRLQSDRIMQDINLNSKKKTYIPINQNQNANPKTETAHKLILQELSSTCQKLSLTCQKLNSQKQTLLNQSNDLKGKTQKQQSQTRGLIQFYKLKFEKQQQQNKMLHETNEAEKQRFYSCLKQIQQSKQSQRKMYEDSIMRLLNNLSSQKGTNLQRRKV